MTTTAGRCCQTQGPFMKKATSSGQGLRLRARRRSYSFRIRMTNVKIQSPSECQIPKHKKTKKLSRKGERGKTRNKKVFNMLITQSFVFSWLFFSFCRSLFTAHRSLGLLVAFLVDFRRFTRGSFHCTFGLPDGNDTRDLQVLRDIQNGLKLFRFEPGEP
jgi:hypothetical protein